MNWAGVAEITAHYGISRQTLANWRAKPGFPRPINNSGAPVWEMIEIETWVRDNTPVGRYLHG